MAGRSMDVQKDYGLGMGIVRCGSRIGLKKTMTNLKKANDVNKVESSTNYGIGPNGLSLAVTFKGKFYVVKILKNMGTAVVHIEEAK
ncbi:MAG: hypothetical protein PHU73_03445 [Patescibacteria group bacterium]|nr:hypothetical protein [Patescibacteria group bacterium]